MTNTNSDSLKFRLFPTKNCKYFVNLCTRVYIMHQMAIISTRRLLVMCQMKQIIKKIMITIVNLSHGLFLHLYLYKNDIQLLMSLSQLNLIHFVGPLSKFPEIGKKKYIDMLMWIFNDMYASDHFNRCKFVVLNHLSIVNTIMIIIILMSFENFI